MSTIPYSAVSTNEASEQQLSLDPKTAVALLGNKGYYEVQEGQPSMPLPGALQMGDSFAFVTGAPVKLIQTPNYPAFLLAGTESKAGPGQPVLVLLPSAIVNGVEVPTESVTDDTGHFVTAFTFKGSGTAFMALAVGDYEHIPFEVIVHPAGFNVATLNTPAKHSSFVNFFKHIVGK